MSGDKEHEAFSRRLQHIDFSSESRIKESLKSRLLKRPAPAPDYSRLIPVFAALALILVIPLGKSLRKHRAGEPGFSFAKDSLGLPILPGRLNSLPTAETSPIQSARGEISEQGAIRSITWRFEDRSFVLETRTMALDELVNKGGAYE